MKFRCSFSIKGFFSKIGRLSLKQFLFFAAAFSVFLSAGCSSRAFYESHRRDRVQECYREYEGTQREQCLERNPDYTEYERQRQESMENP